MLDGASRGATASRTVQTTRPPNGQGISRRLTRKSINSPRFTADRFAEPTLLRFSAKGAPIAVCGPCESASTIAVAHYRVSGQLNPMRVRQSAMAQASVELAQRKSATEKSAFTMRLDHISAQLTKLREESRTRRSRASRGP